MSSRSKGAFWPVKFRQFVDANAGLEIGDDGRGLVGWNGRAAEPHTAGAGASLAGKDTRDDDIAWREDDVLSLLRLRFTGSTLLRRTAHKSVQGDLRPIVKAHRNDRRPRPE